MSGWLGQSQFEICYALARDRSAIAIRSRLRHSLCDIKLLQLLRFKAIMDELRNFEIQKGYAVFRPTGQVSVAQAVHLVTDGIAFARTLDVRKLLVDTTNLTGFESPGVVLRYFLINECARAAGGSVCVALVTRPEMVDSEKVDLRKIGITAAAEIGLTADIFTTEEDALSWLERVK